VGLACQLVRWWDRPVRVVRWWDQPVRWSGCGTGLSGGQVVGPARQVVGPAHQVVMWWDCQVGGGTSMSARGTWPLVDGIRLSGSLDLPVGPSCQVGLWDPFTEIGQFKWPRRHDT
jgi:hypothetical protein